MANDEKHIIDRLFSDGLSEAESPVGKDLWKGIAGQMETQRLRKQVFVARITAAASLLLLLGLSTWFFVSRSFTNEVSSNFTVGEVISLPFEVEDPGTRQLFAAETPSEDASTTPTVLDNPSELPPLAENRKAGLDLSNFFVDQYGRTALSNRVSNNGARGNGLSNAAPSEEMTLAVNTDIDPVVPAEDAIQDEQMTVLADNSLQEDNAVAGDLEKVELPIYQGYPLAGSVASLVSLEEIDNMLEDNSHSEALVASAFDFGKKEEKGSDSRWSFGGAFAPDYSFSTASPLQNQLNNASRSVELQDPAEADKTASSLVTAFTTGVNLAYQVSERVGLQSGVFYSNRRSTTSSDLSSFGQPLLLNSNFSLNQLEIPMLVQYSLIKNDHLDYYVSSGVSANLLWNYNNSITNGQGQVAARVVSDEENTLQPSQGNFLLRTGIRYRLFKKVSLNLEPGMRYGILTNKYSFANGKPVSLSLNSGVNYHF